MKRTPSIEPKLLLALLFISGLAVETEQRLRRRKRRQAAMAIHPSTWHNTATDDDVRLRMEADLVRLRLEHWIDADTYQRRMSSLASSTQAKFA